MSDYHALKQTIDKKKVDFIFHYTTPAGQNAASVDYKDCVKRDKNPTGSLVPNLENDDATEYAKVLTGEIYEDSIQIDFEENMTNQQKLTATNAIWTERNTAFQAAVPIIYKLYCMAQNVE